MKNLCIFSILIVVFTICLSTANVYAGNEQRSASSGAESLLINPWARSSGWADANVACVVGIEAMYQNVAGIAMTSSSEFAFTNSLWLGNTNLYSGGFTTKVGESGVLGASISSLSVGKIDVTTDSNPDGGLGTYAPSSTVVSLAYAREFSKSIYGGINVKLYNDATDLVSTTGLAIDAGIQYVTGFGKDKAGNRNRDNLRFGITMKNVGTPVKYSGNGLSFTGESEHGTSMTVDHRRQEAELPSLIKIGFSYKFKLAPVVEEETKTVTSKHNLELAANFTSNSFTRDQFHLGAEYEFNNVLFLRGGYCYEKGITNSTDRATAFSGPTAGLSLQAPLNKKNKSVLAFDYAYRFTNPFGGVHSFGVRVTL